MTTPELLGFIRSEQAKGVSRETIATLLRVQNWTEEDIAEAFNIIGATPSPQNTISPTTTSPVSEVVFTNYQSAVNSKPHKKLVLGSIIVLLVLLIGGALVYASGTFVSLEKVFSKSLKSTKDALSASFEVDVVINNPGLKDNLDFDGLSNIYTINMKGSYDAIDPDNLKSISSFNFKSGSVEAGLDIRMVDGSLYLNLTKAPNIGIFSLKPFENKWVVIPKEGGNLAMDPLVSSLGVEANPFSTLTDEQKQHLSDLVAKSSFIKVTKKYPPQMINGSLAYHFDFDLDREGIVAFVKESTTYMNSIDQNKGQFPDSEDPNYDEIFEYLQDFRGEAWIGVFDGLPHKVITDMTMKDPVQPENGTTKITTTMSNNDWGKALTVEKPANAQTLDELMSSVMGGIDGGPVQ